MKKVMSNTYFLGRKCIFCGKYKPYRLKNRRLKCKHCKKYYSLKKLQRDLMTLYYFYLEVSARKTARELELNYKTVQSRFMEFRKYIAEYCKQEARKLHGELELDETYLVGRGKAKEEEELITKP